MTVGECSTLRLGPWLCRVGCVRPGPRGRKRPSDNFTRQTLTTSPDSSTKTNAEIPRPKRTQPYKLPAILSLAFRTSNLRRFIGKALHRLSYVKINNEFCAIISANPMMTRYANVRFQIISTDKKSYEQLLSFYITDTKIGYRIYSIRAF